MTKKEARVSALEVLYAADVRGEAPDVEGIGGRARRLVEGTWSRRGELDGEIEHAAKGWRVDRMPVVDRSVLRLALYELRHTDTPMAVVIDQAVELAKAYSTGRSGSFVNGVLGKLAEPPA